MAISFDEKAVKAAEEDYSKVDTDPEQDALITNLAKMDEGILGIRLHAIKDLIGFAIKDLQEATHHTLAGLAGMP